MKTKKSILILIMSLMLILLFTCEHQFSKSFHPSPQSKVKLLTSAEQGFGVLCVKGETVLFTLDRFDGGYMEFYIMNETSQPDESDEEPEPLYSRSAVNFASLIMKAPSTGWMSIHGGNVYEYSSPFKLDARVISPPNSELYTRGIFVVYQRSLEINWEVSDQIEEINISLYKGDSVSMIINSNVRASLKQYKWEIDDDLSGDDFKIKIQDSKNGNLFYYSELISIDPQPLAMAIPSFDVLIVMSSLGVSVIFLIFSKRFTVKC